MSRFPWILLILLLVGTAGGAVWYFNNEHKGNDSSVKEADLPLRAISIGIVHTSVGLAKLNPEQSGRSIEVVEEGKFVNQGDPLLKLDDTFAQFKKKQAEASVKAAEAQLSQAEQLPQKHENDIVIQEAKIEAIQNDREKLKRAIDN